MNDDDYPYKDLPLAPSVIESLIGELFAGQLVERQAIVEEVARVHLARGGKPSEAQSVTGSVKKALNSMAQKGLVQNPMQGYWRIIDVDSVAISAEQNGAAADESAIAPIPIASNTAAHLTAIADMTLGSGAGAIYLYYLPTYRQHALQRGETVWPCKIGRTDRDPMERILSQAATALPERPRVAIILHTPEPMPWETALHGVLTIRGRRLKDSPGSEWFLTSPEEVLSLLRMFDPNACADKLKPAQPSNDDSVDQP